MALQRDHPPVFTEQYRELHSVLSQTCHKCAGELPTQSDVVRIDEIGRREATIILFEYHNKGHEWWPDNQGFVIPGEFRIQKAIAWRYYWDAVDDLRNSKIALAVVNDAVFRTAMRIPFLDDQRMCEDLPGYWHTMPYIPHGPNHDTRVERQQYLEDKLNKTKYTAVGCLEFANVKMILKELHRLQSAVQDEMWELATYQVTVFPNAQTTDLNALNKSRQMAAKLWSEIQDFARKVNEDAEERDEEIQSAARTFTSASR